MISLSAAVSRTAAVSFYKKDRHPKAPVSSRSSLLLRDDVVHSALHVEAVGIGIKMKRKSEFTATITKPGYKPATVQVSHKTAGSGAAGVAGNVLVGGVIGLGVDMYTGASQDLVPNPVKVTLEPEAKSNIVE